MQRMRVVRSSHEWTTNELMNDDRGDKKDGHGNAAGMIGLTGLVALVAVGMLWSISSRKSTNQAVAGLNDMFAEVQQSADAAAAASSPLSLDTRSACVIYKPGRIVSFHIVVHNDDTLEGITPARPVVGLTNGDAISRGQDDQQLQIPAGMTRTLDVIIPYGEQEPASCAVTLSVGAGGTVAMRR
jgi:hypothetical protein